MTVGVGVDVGVADGVCVGDGVGVRVGVDVELGVGVTVDVLVGVAVRVGVCVGVAVKTTQAPPMHAELGMNTHIVMELMQSPGSDGSKQNGAPSTMHEQQPTCAAAEPASHNVAMKKVATNERQIRALLPRVVRRSRELDAR